MLYTNDSVFPVKLFQAFLSNTNVYQRNKTIYDYNWLEGTTNLALIRFDFLSMPPN